MKEKKQIDDCFEYKCRDKNFPQIASEVTIIITE